MIIYLSSCQLKENFVETIFLDVQNFVSESDMHEWKYSFKVHLQVWQKCFYIKLYLLEKSGKKYFCISNFSYFFNEDFKLLFVWHQRSHLIGRQVLSRIPLTHFACRRRNSCQRKLEKGIDFQIFAPAQ